MTVAEPIAEPSPAELTARLKAAAHEQGFVLSGVAPAVSPAGLDHFRAWLAAGYHGEMRYLADRTEAYSHPEQLLAGARSVLLLGLPYRTVEPVQIEPGQGRISRYAWGDDYHQAIRTRLHALADALRTWAPRATTRGVVDTAPIMEREFAQLAGLGWIGKNTLLLNRQWGSWFFLAALITSAELVYDAPHVADHCGTCRACLDACPTEAFVAPYVLDATRCISYLTIELQAPIPRELREPLGEWAFGCDVCQDVCPWNNKAPQVEAAEFTPRESNQPLELAGLFELDEATFRRRFRDSPVWRAHRRGLLRSAAIVLGNQRATSAIPALILGLRDVEPWVRGACAWGLGRMTHDTRVQIALRERLEQEADPSVQDELRAALAEQPANLEGGGA